MLSRATVMLLWTLYVLYPSPRMLGVSIVRAWRPPIDPEPVRRLAAKLPNDPREIERLVNGPLIRYAVPWQTHGVPWYFPTPSEVLARGSGDCEARAVLLASILRAKGVPARLVGSLDHLWVDYPGKHANRWENAEIAIAAQQIDGSYSLRWPSLIQWRSSWTVERAYFWDPMPGYRLVLLVAGWALACLSLSRRISYRLLRRFSANLQPAAVSYWLPAVADVAEPVDVHRR